MSNLTKTLRNLFDWYNGTSVSSAPVPHEEGPLDFAGRIVKAMKAHDCPVTEKEDEVNIVYVDGVNRDGTKNKNDSNSFDDARILIQYRSGKPVIIGAWEAVTSTAKYYTEHRINSRGAARIAWGYQVAWQVGMHHGKQEALIQTGGEVSVYRDDNEDYKRDGDKLDTGWFGINQHGGYNFPHDDVKTASAGCLVGRMVDGHEDFMRIVKTDARYVKNHRYIFGTTVMPVDWLEAVPTEKPSVPTKPTAPVKKKTYTYSLAPNAPIREYLDENGAMGWMAKMGASNDPQFNQLPATLKKDLLNGVPVLEAVETYHTGLSPAEQARTIDIAKSVGVNIE